jgi:hypothetical protein
MTYLKDCQIPGYQRVADGEAEGEPNSPVRLLKRALARPWNYEVRPRVKKIVKWALVQKKKLQGKSTSAAPTNTSAPRVPLLAGDVVRVRSREEIQATLDPFNELKGCAMLEYMWQYCGTTQRVLQPVERFLDERDYKVKKSRGVILLEGVICRGTPVFGRCDRCCFLFWREEWLEKIAAPQPAEG